MSVTLISGPPVTGPQGMSKEAAEQALLRNATFPKGADYQLMAHQGQWIAAVSTPDFQKQAEFPPSGGDDGSSDGPPSDGGPDDSDAGSDGPPSDGGSDSGGGDGPPKHDDKEKGGDKGGLHALEAKLDLLLSALGIDPSGMGGDPSMGGGDPGMGGPPGAGGPPPPGPAGHHAPPPPPGQMAGGRPIKPGETPPGAVPGGPPTFSSVKETHPWGHMIGKQAAFTVRESMGPDEDITQVHDELQSLAKAGGFRVARFTPFHDEQNGRHVEAVINTPKQ